MSSTRSTGLGLERLSWGLQKSFQIDVRLSAFFPLFSSEGDENTTEELLALTVNCKGQAWENREDSQMQW